VYFTNWFKSFLYEKLKNGKYVEVATYIPSIVSAIHVFISQIGYQKIAHIMAKFENH